MAKSIDVNLPRSHLVRFPERCVVCGHPTPDALVRVRTGTIGWWSWLLRRFGNTFVVKAPACTRCAMRLHAFRFLSLLTTVALVAGAFWFIWPHFKGSIPRPMHKLGMMALGIFCCLPQIIFEIFFAAPFNLTAYADSVDYEFTSEAYAAEFAALNADAEWVKVDGKSVG